MTPLHQAVIEGHLSKIAQLKDSKWSLSRDSHGFTPLELAQLLGQKQAQHLLLKTDPLEIKVQLKGQSSPRSYSIAAFEQLFCLTYRRFLVFPSYASLKTAIDNCPYLLRLERFLNSSDAAEMCYQGQAVKGLIAKVVIKWINPLLGYGLFADADLPEKTFIGEYTGIVRRVEKANPQLNAYCFHYPTRFWSLNYLVIDALQEGNVLRFINHSDQPNLQPLWLVNRGVLHLIFITRHRIAKGMQLTFDYGRDHWLHRKTKVPIPS